MRARKGPSYSERIQGALRVCVAIRAGSSGRSIGRLIVARMRDRKWLLVLLCAVAVTAAVPISLRAQGGKVFAVPTDGPVIWQAEDAARDGQWTVVKDPSASGGSYVQARGREAILRFPIHVDQPTILEVRPVWWRDGERKPSRRFPYPLQRLPGPDALARCGQTIFFTATAASRVGYLEAEAA